MTLDLQKLKVVERHRLWRWRVKVWITSLRYLLFLREHPAYLWPKSSADLTTNSAGSVSGHQP